MTSPAPLLRHRDGAVEEWTLNRPDTRNPISDTEMIEALETAVDAVDADHDVRAVVITGAGSAFSSGGNEAQAG